MAVRLDHGPELKRWVEVAAGNAFDAQQKARELVGIKWVLCIANMNTMRPRDAALAMQVDQIPGKLAPFNSYIDRLEDSNG